MNESWSDQLVKKSISDFLIEELEEHLPENELESTRNQLSILVSSREDLDKLKAAISSLEEKVEEGFFDYLMEEYDEIEDDLDWKDTEKGKSVISINDWVQSFFQEFRSNNAYEDVLIGGHTSKIVVFVTGSVKYKDDLDNLVQYVNSKSPPLEVLWDVKVNT